MKIRDIATMALLTAILFVGQIGLSFLPNIEIVSLLVIVYTQLYRKKVFLIIYVFALLQGLTYGFSLFWAGYLYVWSILALIVLLLKEQKSYLVWAVVSGAFGLAYGFLYAIPVFITSGAASGMSFWIAGIPFDIAHCVGNAVVAVLLYKPIYHVLYKLVMNQKQDERSVAHVAKSN